MHVKSDRLREARICVSEACRKKPEDFRMWDNNAQICLALDDVRAPPHAGRTRDVYEPRRI